jgi:hypothetical protein
MPDDYPTFVESLKDFAGRFEETAIVANDFIKQAAKAANLNARIVDDISEL